MREVVCEGGGVGGRWCVREVVCEGGVVCEGVACEGGGV